MTTVSELCVNAIRGMLIAGEGKKLVVSDLSNIEGRVAAWLANEEWKLQAFRDFDTIIGIDADGEPIRKGHDLYKIGAGRILGKRPEDVTKLERQNEGKVPELACFGARTIVVTRGGLKNMKDVLPDDQLWDGVEWVKHQGLIDRGRRKVMMLDGVQVTHDHRVLAGETWLSAEMVGSSQTTLDLALATGTASLQSLASRQDLWGACGPSLFSARAENRLTALLRRAFGKGRLLGVLRARKEPSAASEKSGSSTQKCARTTCTADDSAIAYPPPSIGATTPVIERIRTTAAEGYPYTRLGARTAASISRILSRLKAGTTHLSRSTGLTSIEATSPETYVSSPNAPTATTSARSETCKPRSTGYVNVFDIVNAGPRNRFTIISDHGALVVHNCQFQGAVGAFATMGANFGVVLPEERVIEIVKAWRKSHPRIVSTWYAIEDAAKAAIRFPHERFEVNGFLHFDNVDGWLRVRLPSGRYLSYPKARVGQACPRCDGTGKHLETGVANATKMVVCLDCDGSGKADTQIRYDGVDQYTKKWGTIASYGGKFFENIVQATARDVFMCGFRAAEREGYTVVTRVHDELVTEVPDDVRYSAERLSALMAANPSWAVGLPLAAAGHEMYRYSKLD